MQYYTEGERDPERVGWGRRQEKRLGVPFKFYYTSLYKLQPPCLPASHKHILALNTHTFLHFSLLQIFSHFLFSPCALSILPWVIFSSAFHLPFLIFSNLPQHIQAYLLFNSLFCKISSISISFQKHPLTRLLKLNIFIILRVLIHGLVV